MARFRRWPTLGVLEASIWGTFNPNHAEPPLTQNRPCAAVCNSQTASSGIRLSGSSPSGGWNGGTCGLPLFLFFTTFLGHLPLNNVRSPVSAWSYVSNVE